MISQLSPGTNTKKSGNLSTRTTLGIRKLLSNSTKL
jgi:hypothetical protein